MVNKELLPLLRGVVMASLAICTMAATGEDGCPTGNVVRRLVDAPAVRDGFGVWPSTPPEDCPFPQSAAFCGVEFTGRHAEYTAADTWYPSWASDGDMYSPWTDGVVEWTDGDGKKNRLRSWSGKRAATTGHAKIVGDDPLNLKIVDAGLFKSDPHPYEGRYPCGSLVHNGVWYYGTYCLNPLGKTKGNEEGYPWVWLGPFVGFRWSTDYGKTWTQTPCTPEKPLFGENGLQGEPVKIGCPCFVDFGKNMEHSPDGKAYLVVQGSSDGKSRRYAYNSWINSDQTYLIRVTPSIANMNDASMYEFFAGYGADGKAQWTRDFAKMKPLLEWRDRMGRVSATYNPALRKYFMCVTDGRTTISKYNTYILEADEITGPWRLVTYMQDFGEQAYFVNIPSKFIEAKNGRTMWLCYAANWWRRKDANLKSMPFGSRYGMCLQEFRLVTPDEKRPAVAPAPNPLLSPQNLARKAKVRTSSDFPDYSGAGAVDGVIGGYPNDISAEWAAKDETCTAFIRLDWEKPQTIRSVWLFDRPNDIVRIEDGLLVFSDGTTIRTGALPDDAKKGVAFEFPPKTVRWVMFTVEKVNKGGCHVGLSEIAVF